MIKSEEVAVPLRTPEFAQKLDDLSVLAADRLSEEEHLSEVIERVIGQHHTTHSEDDDMYLELLWEEISGAMSSEELATGRARWIRSEELDALIDQRGNNAKRHTEALNALLEEALSRLQDPFERYALQQHLGYAPVAIDGLLTSISQTLGYFDELNQLSINNPGEIVTSMRLGSPQVGKLKGEPIYLKDRALVVPTVPGSTFYAFDGLHGRTRIKPTHNIAVSASDHDDDPLSAVTTADFLKITDSSAGNIFNGRMHENIFILGQIPQGPMFYDGDQSNPYYRQNVAFYEKHIAVIRKLTGFALRA